jgi:hypothetical protein
MKTYDEKVVAGLLMAPEDEVALVRQTMDEGVHYVSGDFGTRFVEDGVQALIEVFELNPKKMPRGFWQKLEADWVDHERRQIKKAVFYNKSQNRRVIVAQAGALLIRVHVHDDVNFKPGMEMPVEWVEGDLYKITRPSPRYLGRW